MGDTPFFVATSLSAIAEVGDKSQLMALLLGLRFRRPVVVLGGIFVAALASSLLAGIAGEWLAGLVKAEVLRWAIGLLFAATAIWMILPDEIDRDDILAIAPGGVVLATAASFFLAECGGRSQLVVATVAAQFKTVVPVAFGATLGIMLANAPFLLLGSAAGNWLTRPSFRIAAALFALSGLLTVLEMRG